MRYIGGKSLLLNEIYAVVKENAPDAASIFDIFAGTCAVGSHFKRVGYKVWSNDFLYFSYALQRCKITLNTKPTFHMLDPIAYLNGLRTDVSVLSDSAGFITLNYSPSDTCGRMYFQTKNALHIDATRQTLERWRNENLITEDGYFYLLAALIEAVPYVANITGTYAAYLKYWDKRSGYDLCLQEPMLYDNGKDNHAICADFHDVLDTPADLLYADPPYNSRSYGTYYHILETIARYDAPDIKGITGMRQELPRSTFCSKKTVEKAFIDLIEGWKGKYILISYNNEGLLQSDRLMKICRSFAIRDTFRLYEFPQRRYKNKIPNNTPGLKEQLYFLRRN